MADADNVGTAASRGEEVAIDLCIVAKVRIEQNFPPLKFRQYLSFQDKNHMGERKMPRRVQKHPQNCKGVST